MNYISQCATFMIQVSYDATSRSAYFFLCLKVNGKTCEQYRTHTVVSHTSNIIFKCVQGKVECMLSEDQFDFRKGRDTRDAISGLRAIVENAGEKKKTHILR